MSPLEQNANIKFCVCLEKSPETLEMLKKAYGNYSSTIEFVPFSWLKMNLMEPSFVESDEVIQNVVKQMKDLTKNLSQKSFEQLYECWNMCVDAGGQYFAGKQDSNSVPFFFKQKLFFTYSGNFL
ncbi:uncharacterized protein TNCV_3396001 [Trichonephila clavipes]|nr:uncharacterized protein TNCV_3396001 [Trichonephila clavipes]